MNSAKPQRRKRVVRRKIIAEADGLYLPSDWKRRKRIPDNPVEPYRTPARRDYARLIHSPAFRRLQGKTQLFPGIESDFFRNRLTHSLEVAQIGKSIAIRLNSTSTFLNRPGFHINTDLIETAALAHDLGHPPFGHNGELALDEAMRDRGGFEGNAQTLRILTRLEKREKTYRALPSGANLTGSDGRFGLNLSFRTLAAILKYDREIPLRRSRADRVCKGYYNSEASIVRKIKDNVCGGKNPPPPFKTIECCLMDLADDIAYSTYDLEDAFKGGFIKPLDMLTLNPTLADRICKKISPALGRTYTRSELSTRLFEIFRDILLPPGLTTIDNPEQIDIGEAVALSLIAHRASEELAGDGYLRSRFTSELVGKFIAGIEVCDENEDIPALTKVKLNERTLEYVEVLKNFTFESLIMSPRLKVSEFRGREIVTELFEVLTDFENSGFHLLPDDVRMLHSEISASQQDRVICDFIAGMTDRYAIEFYARLKSERPETIFKPL